jgi:8-oxo-dGTP pyrophosphatase MutT (NUDIX family)
VVSNINKDVLLTSEDIWCQLLDTELPTNPTEVSMSIAESCGLDLAYKELSEPLKAAGVLVPIIEREGNLYLLLTHRSTKLKHHAGQISFPGGQMEQGDRDIEKTALRETEEEVGIASHFVSVMGYLNTIPTMTGYAVTPIVGLVAPGVEPNINDSEVEYAFEVPLSFLMDGTNNVRGDWMIYGRKVSMIEFHWESERIWGATAFIIISLIKLLNKQ